MSQRPIIDAGPSLNFFSINKERLLIGMLGPLSVPETVEAEVLRKSRKDARFRSAATVWRKLTPRWLQIISDDETPVAAVLTGSGALSALTYTTRRWRAFRSTASAGPWPPLGGRPNGRSNPTRLGRDRT
jgi:hypothetical protein